MQQLQVGRVVLPIGITKNSRLKTGQTHPPHRRKSAMENVTELAELCQ
jgi:hypothetical protein